MPTVAESGYPGFEAGTWYAFLGPAGLPREIQAKLAADIVAVTQLADVRARFSTMGVEAIGTTPTRLATIMQDDLEKWGRGHPQREHQAGMSEPDRRVQATVGAGVQI